MKKPSELDEIIQKAVDALFTNEAGESAALAQLVSNKKHIGLLHRSKVYIAIHNAIEAAGDICRECKEKSDEPN